MQKRKTRKMKNSAEALAKVEALAKAWLFLFLLASTGLVWNYLQNSSTDK